MITENYLEFLDKSPGDKIVGFNSPGFYFHDKIWKAIIGPYPTKEEAEKAFEKYIAKHSHTTSS